MTAYAVGKEGVMKFLTGKHYPHMCEDCRSEIDQCAEEMEALRELGEEGVVSGRVIIEFDDNEAPNMWAYDRRLFCGNGGSECVCDCSKGFPKLDTELDVFCTVHGGTDEEQQVARVKLCEKDGHIFPLWTAREKRDWVCLMCLHAYGRWDNILQKHIETAQN